MKYKVGDKVRIINNDDNDFDMGETAIIEDINEGIIDSICCKNEHNLEWLIEVEVAPLEYTWEDFIKAPIGTKITFENGDIFVKSYEGGFDNNTRDYCYWELIEFKDNNTDIEYNLGKIIKIEEPIYTTVYEPAKVVMPEIEEMKGLTDELYKTYNEFIKKIKENK